MPDALAGIYAPISALGNLYFVGTEPASTHIIDTGDGDAFVDPFAWQAFAQERKQFIQAMLEEETRSS